MRGKEELGGCFKEVIYERRLGRGEGVRGL